MHLIKGKILKLMLHLLAKFQLSMQCNVGIVTVETVAGLKRKGFCHKNQDKPE